MSKTLFDIRQSQTRVLQDQLNASATVGMDSTLASINNELTSPGRLIAAATPSLVVTVGSGTVVNPNTSKNRVLPFISNAPVSFTGGTITFPGGSGGGTITVSPGTNATITIGASQFVAVLVQLNASGQLSLVVGSAAGSLGAVTIPSGSTSLLSLGYIIVQSNVSSVIQNITNSMLYQFVGGGGSGGSGSGTGDDLDALQYNASFTEPLTSLPGSTTSSIDTTNTKGTYSAANNTYTLSYDASKTVTANTGTTMHLSATPAYTVAVGDMLVVGTQARKITVLGSINSDGGSGTPFTIEAAFTTNPSASAATVSQAVYSQDINNFAGDGVSIASIYTDSIFDALVTYNDTNSGILYNSTDPAVVAYTVSADGTNYSSVATREANLSVQTSYTSTPTSGTNLYLRFFANKTSGSGTVNLVGGYKAFFHRTSQTESGGILNQAYCFTNSVGTPVNCSNPTVVGGKTQIVLNFSYPVGVNSGTANGGILVYLNGQKIPRFVNSTLTPDASYTETSANTITLDVDYSSLNYAVEVYQNVAVVDSNTQNTTNITAIQTSQLRNSLINGNFDFWQRGTSVTVANGVSTYQADRWYVKNSLGTNGVITYSQNAPGLTNSKFGAKVQITTAPTAAQANGCELYQTLENEDSLIYLNSTASFSINIKALGNVTSVGLQFFYATSETKVTTALGSEKSVTVNTTSFALGQLVAQSISTLPTTSGVLGVRVRILGVSSGNTYDLNNGFIVEQAMMNLGPTCLPYFQRAATTIAGELMLCQRYYEKSYATTTNPGTAGDTNSPLQLLVGINGSASNSQIAGTQYFKVQKRVAPTMTAYETISGTINLANPLVNSGSRSGTTTFTAANNNLFSTTSNFAYQFNNGTSFAGIFFGWTAEAEI